MFDVLYLQWKISHSRDSVFAMTLYSVNACFVLTFEHGIYSGLSKYNNIDCIARKNLEWFEYLSKDK